MQHQVVSHKEWLKARLELVAAEKEFTRQRDDADAPPNGAALGARGKVLPV